MKRLLLATALLVWCASASAQTCNFVNDHYYWFGGNSYNHVLNGYGTSLNCWSTPSTLGTVSITSGTCGLSSTQGFTFAGWSPTLEQTFQTGSGNSGTTWSLQYELDFNDPTIPLRTSSTCSSMGTADWSHSTLTTAAIRT